jgi:8-oxo-dGTP pyrophosphatase MutT (NUDIX family)
MKTERQISSGGVVFRRIDDNIEIALIAVKDGSVWCLPKGLIEKGEGLARAAHREVREETGMDGKIIKLIDYIKYFYAHKEKTEAIRYLKIVYFFLMEYTGGDVKNHDSEVDDCRWFPIDEAIDKIEYKDEKEILKKAKRMMLRAVKLNQAKKGAKDSQSY